MPSVCRAVSYRRNLRHTSPLRDLPAEVRVIRPHHALAGKVLKVFGKLTRKGQLHLVLTLPDGTRSYIPATWTDLQAPDTPSVDRGSSLVARQSDLLRARQRVDALLRRMKAISPGVTTSTPENQRAAKSNGTMERGTPSDPAHLRTAQPQAADAPHPSPGVSDAKIGPQSTRPENSPNTKEYS
jgi:hypothetical protein